jgi:hypothetical protein
MLSNQIDTILGFNFIAPYIFSGGDNLLENFLLKWIGGNEFIDSWKDIRNLGIVERGYLKKNTNGVIKYAFAKAYSDSSDARLIWQKERTVEEALMFSNCFNNLHDMNFKQKNVYPICRVHKYKIAEGKQNNLFDYDSKITRAEFTKMLLIASDIQDKNKNIQDKIEEEAKNPEKPFPDVEIDAWYYPYVNYAKAHQIIKGYKKDGIFTFEPQQTIPFREASKIIVNTLIGKIDDEDGDDWWIPFINKLKEKGIPIYKQDYNISRAEMAEIVIKILEG